MEKEYSWKRTEDVEIDLADFMHRLLGQWKRIAVCALAAAVMTGAYGWTKGRSSLKEEASGITKEAELTDAEAQAVADAVWLEHEIQGLQTYLNNSVLMQLDPYHKNKRIMLYRIDQVQRQQQLSVTESYLNFITNGGAADALLEAGNGQGLNKSCLAELISTYQKTYSSPYLLFADDSEKNSQTMESLFYVEITGKDARMTEQMSLDLQSVLKKYSGSLKKNLGNHRLTLVSSMENVTADSGLQSQQHDKKAALSASKTNLKTLTNAFNKEQMAAYKEAADIKDEEDQQEEHVSDEDKSGGSLRHAVTYIFLGFAAGIFVYSCIYMCWYIFCDKVKNTEEMRRRYNFPVFGGVLTAGKNGKCSRTVPKARFDAYGQTEIQIFKRICLACQKDGINRLYAVTDFSLSPVEKKCLESMKDQLKCQGIDMEVSEQVSTDTAVWERIAETGTVLMVCRIGTTTHRMIDDAMSFYAENNIAVAGAAVFMQI